MTNERACANEGVVSRRALLAALPASTLALATVASSTPSDPILEHYKEWLGATAEWNRLSSMPGNEDWKWPASIEAERKADAALDAMVELTPSSLAGIAAMAHILWVLEGPVMAPGGEDHAEEMTWKGNRAILAIWQAATGLDGYPSV